MSVIVPAYNEGVVLENACSVVAASDYPDVEVICVDDGSSDNTYDLMRQLAAELPGVTAMRQQNAGKGAALNRGIKASRGEVLLLVDADGVFARDTITEMVRGFDDDLIGAVCGDDRPVNLDRVQTRFLALIGHVGTGLMRRALHMLGALPVVSGNSGAFRRDVLDATGLLREDTIGEDLELTWRIYRAGYRVAFRPTALVYAESPSTFRGLWKQRVRWSRGLLPVDQAAPRHGRQSAVRLLRRLPRDQLPHPGAGAGAAGGLDRPARGTRGDERRRGAPGDPLAVGAVRGAAHLGGAAAARWRSTGRGATSGSSGRCRCGRSIRP
ncbi:MAG: glycosyltransferase family 2 protein [Micropruina sp.]